MVAKKHDAASDDIVFPIMDTAYWALHYDDAPWLQQIRNSEFLKEQLKSRTTAQNLYFFGTDRYSEYFNTLCNWDFINGRAVPISFSHFFRRLYLFSSDPWDTLTSEEITKTLTGPLASGSADGFIIRRSLMHNNTVGSLTGIPFSSIHSTLSPRETPWARVKDVRSLLTPDIVYAEDSLVLEQYNWEMSTEETRTIIRNPKRFSKGDTLDPIVKFVAKEEYQGWLKNYAARIMETIFNVLTPKELAERAINVFIEHGYLEPLDSSHYLWTGERKDFACWECEMFVYLSMDHERTSVPHELFTRFVLTKDGKPFRDIKNYVNKYVSNVNGTANLQNPWAEYRKLRNTANLDPEQSKIVQLFSSM